MVFRLTLVEMLSGLMGLRTASRGMIFAAAASAYSGRAGGAVASVTIVLEGLVVEVLPRRRELEIDDLREKEDLRSLVRTLGECEPLSGGGIDEPSRVVGRVVEVVGGEVSKKLLDGMPGDRYGRLVGGACMVSYCWECSALKLEHSTRIGGRGCGSWDGF